MARFVVADDSQVTRNFLVATLSRMGHEVVAHAKTGVELIDACRAHKPDFVISDISMPVLNGDEAAPTIVDEKLADHVVMLTSVPNPSITNKLREIGCVIWSKPIKTEAMLRARLAPFFTPSPEAA